MNFSVIYDMSVKISKYKLQGEIMDKIADIFKHAENKFDIQLNSLWDCFI